MKQLDEDVSVERLGDWVFVTI